MHSLSYLKVTSQYGFGKFIDLLRRRGKLRKPGTENQENQENQGQITVFGKIENQGHPLVGPCQGQISTFPAVFLTAGFFHFVDLVC